MLFPTLAFALFFGVVLALHWTLPERGLLRKCALLAASIFFYAWWSWKFAIFTLASAVFNHDAAIFIASASDKRQRKIRLISAIAVNLAFLALFKYTNFIFMQGFHPLAVICCRQFDAVESLLDFEDKILPFLESIILPIGISFYTFQAIAYVSDVASDKIKPVVPLLDFANYLLFFPKLCAGPIVRPGDLIPQMEALPSRDTRIDTGRAATLILGGLFKKVVVANWISQHLANPVFTDPESFGTVDALLGVYGYTIQIYCDFSAYSDIAIGLALLMGFTFPENFRAPYISTSLQEFWRRWHITLSSWLRDYLYIPLGGSRCAKWKIHRNLMLTMLLGGLWHGAGWSYILWGAIHGLGQVLERPFNKKRPADAPPRKRAVVILRGIITFHVVAFAWIFFRAGAIDAEGLTTVRNVLTAIGHWSIPATLLSPLAIVFLLLGFSLQLLDGETPRRLWNAFNRLPPLVQGLLAALILTIVFGLGPAGVAPFIYFQF